MGLGPSTFSPAIVEGAVRLGSAVPFARAAALLTQFTGVAMSSSTLRRLTQAAGAACWAQEAAISAGLWAGTIPAERVIAAEATGPLQLSIDGSMVAVRGDGWREVKVLAIGERTATGVDALSYAAVLGDAERFGDLVLGEVTRRGVATASDVVAVNDGAVWIQGILDLHCPQAGRVLDFMHATSYLASVASEAFGDGTADARTWFAAQRETLRDGDPEDVLTAIAALPSRAARDTALGYLGSRRDQIQYRTFRNRDWPIGSGCVESAHKRLVQTRLTGPGMRWRADRVEPMLALQLAEVNGRWTAQWPAVRRAPALARHPVPRPCPRPDVAGPPTPSATVPPSIPRPKTIVNGKPTAAHPWKRSLLR